MKRLDSFILIVVFLFIQNLSAAASNNVRSFFTAVDDYQYKTVLKYYTPYSIGIVNDNTYPILFSANSEIKFIDTKGQEHLFPDNKMVYKKSRKNDVGKYYWISLPSAALGGAVTGFTFGLGIIAGLGITIAGAVPYIRASLYNSNVATNLYIENKVPLSLEPKQFQMIYVFLPKSKKTKIEIEKVVICNLYMNNSKPFNINIPVRKELI